MTKQSIKEARELLTEENAVECLDVLMRTEILWMNFEPKGWGGKRTCDGS